jgi:hypothetical protein
MRISKASKPNTFSGKPGLTVAASDIAILRGTRRG